MKRPVMSGLAAMLLLTGCAREAPRQQPVWVTPARPVPAPDAPPPPAPVAVPPPVTDGAATAQQLAPDQVLNRASFRGGTLGDQAFHGGQVLLWQPEPNRYRLRASLDLGGGHWRSTNNTNDIIFEPAPFIASVALLNDVEQVERAVPLWVFYGHVANPEIAQVEVRVPGVQLQRATINRGTWLLLHQGVLFSDPVEGAEVIAYNAAHQEIAREPIKQ